MILKNHRTKKVRMQTIPKDLIKEIIFLSSLDDILHLCQVDKRFHTVCADQKIWEVIYKRDFPEKKKEEQKKVNWRELVKREWQRRDKLESFLKKYASEMYKYYESPAGQILIVFFPYIGAQTVSKRVVDIDKWKLFDIAYISGAPRKITLTPFD